MTKEAIFHKLFGQIKVKLSRELIGQREYINALTSYFEKKYLQGSAGTLFLIGEKDTAKKTSVRLLFEYLYENQIIDYKYVEEIDLTTYDFTLGYNAFLTDLYEKLSSPSKCLIFRNFDCTTPQILKTLGHIYPNTCLYLDREYQMDNRFLVEAKESGVETINHFVCHNKFLVFTSNNPGVDLTEFFEQSFISGIDEVLYPQTLSPEERYKVFKKEILKVLKYVEEKLEINLQIELKGTDGLEDDYGICDLFVRDFSPDSNLGIGEYVNYKLYKPIRNLMLTENVAKDSKAFIFVRENKVVCQINDIIYILSDYSVPTLEEAKYKLNKIVGVKDLKRFIYGVENNFKVQNIRGRLGLRTSKVSLNMIFAGNAGTGKTNAARITFEYLNALGILSKGIFREVSKADFIPDDIADIAKRTNDIVLSAVGGVLFIDEAYSLYESEEDRVGKEIVDALIKGIEDNREDLVVILAGYEKDMMHFLEANQGLKSRFPNWVSFEDYNPSQMYKIAVGIARSKGYRIAKGVKPGLIDLFSRNIMTGRSGLGNARFVRNVIENAILDASKKYLQGKVRAIDLLDKDNFNFKVDAKFDIEKELNEIIGLEKVKELLRSQYKLIIAQEKRKSVGVNTKIEQNLNMVFLGNPGTGKTSIARLVAKMLSSMGILKVGQLIETDRSNFVAETSAETATKTDATFKEAIGGILFIDEAYTLANDRLGRESIEVLLKLIEDYSNEVIVILAGYEEEMEHFFEVNIGLRSRFPLTTVFEDYKPDELLSMAIKLLHNKGFKLSKNGYSALKKSFVAIYEEADAASGNGRMVRNYVENIIRNQSIRISENDVSVYEMNLITAAEIEGVKSSEYSKSFDLEEKLKQMVGNEEAKNFLREYYYLIMAKDRRAKKGMSTKINPYNNVIFSGEIGTGKRLTVHLFAQMLSALGQAKSKQVVEQKASVWGTRMLQVEERECMLQELDGRVLYITHIEDLLESLDQEEVIDRIIQFMDQNKERVYIVLSGEPGGMKALMKRYPILHYRVPIWVNFESYKAGDLYKIAVKVMEERGFELDIAGQKELMQSIEQLIVTPHLGLKNDLFVKKFVECILRIQCIRVVEENLETSRLSKIITADILGGRNAFLNHYVIFPNA